MKSSLQNLTDLIRVREKYPSIIQVQSWINSNSNSLEKNVIWRIGICDATHLMEIEGKIRSDFECKNFKHWRMNSFQEGVEAITHLTKSKSIFKSPHHRYLGKGNYLFIYKTPCPFKANYHHALHY